MSHNRKAFNQNPKTRLIFKFSAVIGDIVIFWQVISNLKLQCEADEEIVDPKKYYEDTCKPKCVRPLRAYQACVERVKGDETGHKHCTGQYFDYWSCVDACVAPKLFDKLK
ncbi:putative cytochrome b-c1 complex, subunit 6, ubiquinol-cytochrome C reductase hinge [Dioscorea sansibarensis]